MNQKQLEVAVRKMQSDSALDPERKAYLMQNIMASRYIVAQQRRLSDSQSVPGIQTPSKTFHDAAKETLGCPHYKRKYAVAGIIASVCMTKLSEPWFELPLAA